MADSQWEQLEEVFFTTVAFILRKDMFNTYLKVSISIFLLKLPSPSATTAEFLLVIRRTALIHVWADSCGDFLRNCAVSPFMKYSLA